MKARPQYFDLLPRALSDPSAVKRPYVNPRRAIYDPNEKQSAHEMRPVPPLLLDRVPAPDLRGRPRIRTGVDRGGTHELAQTLLFEEMVTAMQLRQRRTHTIITDRRVLLRVRVCRFYDAAR
jgi:hypothetical protein